MDRVIDAGVTSLHRVKPLWTVWIAFVRGISRLFRIRESVVRRLAPFDMCELPGVLRFGGHSLRHNHDYIAWRLYFLGAWEPAVARAIGDHLPEDGTFVDIGANIGLHAIPASDYCKRVIAFEPYPPNLEILRLNAGGIANIEVVGKACSDRSGTMALYYPPNDGDSERPRNLGLPSLAEIPSRSLEQSVEVSVITLDSMALDRVDVVKIDVEGFEGAVLAGARETIERHRPVIEMEWSIEAMTHSTFAPEKVWQLISQMGYAVFSPDGRRRIKRFAEMPVAGDVLLSPRNSQDS